MKWPGFWIAADSGGELPGLGGRVEVEVGFGSWGHLVLNMSVVFFCRYTPPCADLVFRCALEGSAGQRGGWCLDGSYLIDGRQTWMESPHLHPHRSTQSKPEVDQPLRVYTPGASQEARIVYKNLLAVAGTFRPFSGK